MYITYEQYKALGYNSIDEPSFPRYEALARKIVDKYTFNRVTAENATVDNRRGMCEMMNVFYNDDNQINLPIVSFSNEGYSETRAVSLVAHQKTAAEKAVDLLDVYFTSAQLYRGV